MSGVRRRRGAVGAGAAGAAGDDDDFDLIDHGRNPSLARRSVYFGAASLCVLLIVYLYVALLHVRLSEAALTLLAGSVVAAALLSMAYHNIFFSTRVRVQKDAMAPTKSAFKRNSNDYDVALTRYETRCSLAAFSWSLFYNNAMFLAIALGVGLYVFNNKIPAEANFVGAVVGASGFAFFNSRKAMQAIGEL